MKAEAVRLYNYPFEALEEVVANAFYHRSYELQSPVEINVWPDRIEVLSYPGPLPPVTREKLKERRIVARDYRNRRVGDFFKELMLTEGRATGFSTIYDSMEENGSPIPFFETDDDFNYFLAVLPVHRDFLLPAAVKNGSIAPADMEQYILSLCLQPLGRGEILARLDLKNHLGNYRKYLLPLIERGWLALTHPGVKNSPYQKYFTTDPGKERLQELRDKRADV